jgi:hypothetical protein
MIMRGQLEDRVMSRLLLQKLLTEKDPLFDFDESGKEQTIMDRA